MPTIQDVTEVEARLAEDLDATRLLVAEGDPRRFHQGPLADAARRLFETLGAVLGAPR